MSDSLPFGDEQKRVQFATLALPCMKSIYSTALRLTRRQEEASDLVQEAYLRAYRTFSNFTLGTNFKAWLFTIMYSTFVNKYRKEQREPKSISIEELDEKFHRSLTAAAVDTYLEQNLIEVGTEVDKALNQLPDKFRLAILLVDIEEMSYEEAAAVLRCPVGTLRSRLFRARKLLFIELQPYARRKGYVQSA